MASLNDCGQFHTHLGLSFESLDERQRMKKQILSISTEIIITQLLRKIENRNGLSLLSLLNTGGKAGGPLRGPAPYYYFIENILKLI